MLPYIKSNLIFKNTPNRLRGCSPDRDATVGGGGGGDEPIGWEEPTRRIQELCRYAKV